MKFRNIFGVLAVLALFALATAPPGFAGGGSTNILYLIDNDLNAGAIPDPGDIQALVTSASGMKTDFAASAVKPEKGDSPLFANAAPEGGGFFGTGAKSAREYAI